MQKFCLLLVMVGLACAGCSSAPDRNENRAEQNVPNLPAMEGEKAFADGKLLVEASLSRGTRPFGGRGEGGGRRGSRRHSGEGGGERRQRSGGGDYDETPAEAQPRFHDSTMPPIVLQLRVTNKSNEPLEITWVECNSALGNFGVRPEKMSLAAGETADTERMTSLLGASADEMPVTVTLRVLGKQEEKTLILRPVATDVK